MNNLWKQQISQVGAEELLFGIRPEHTELSAIPLPNGLRGQVKYVENQGNNYGVYLDVDGQELIAMSENGNWQDGQDAYVRPFMEKFHFFFKHTEKNIGYPQQMKVAEEPHYLEEGKVTV